MQGRMGRHAPDKSFQVAVKQHPHNLSLTFIPKGMGMGNGTGYRMMEATHH